ncbi:MAG: low temperature requirement protein A, partial [bacterium]
MEYIELIYDLIFVYLVGRNNSLMDQLAGGFVTAETLITYL